MKTVFITGATDGIGKHVATELVQDGHTLLVHGRNQEKLDGLVLELNALNPDAIIRPYLADLADLAQVAELARDITADWEQLNVLINNAGVGFGEPGETRQTGVQGYELRFTVNYLAPVLLALKLTPLLRRSAPARIVNVASLGQQALNFEDIQFEHGYNGTDAYRRSKAALVMATLDYASQLAGSGVTVNAVHPASFADATMVRTSGIPPQSTVAAGPVIRLAIGLEVSHVTGAFFNQLQEAKAIPQAYDQAARDRLSVLTRHLLKTYLAV